MKKSILFLIAACLGCCAILFIPALAGMSLFGLSWLNPETALCALPLLGIGAIVIYMVIKKLRRTTACAVDKSCGCK